MVLVETLDQPFVCQQLASGAPLLLHDVAGGPRAGNAAGAACLTSLIQQLDRDATALIPAVEWLLGCQFLPPDVIVCCIAADVWASPDSPAFDASTVAALLRLRDLFKRDGRVLVLLSPPGVSLPVAIAADVTRVVDPLPSRGELAEMLARLARDAGVDMPSAGDTDALSDALAGLSAYAAEQAAAEALTPSGYDVGLLWRRAVAAVNATPGLELLYRDDGSDPLDDLHGLEASKRFVRAAYAGPSRPRATLWIDEIEKALAGSSGVAADTSGVSQSLLGYLLTWLSERDPIGCLLLGPPGSGKSALAAAAGRVTIRLDLGEVKSSLVGSSEARMRAALATIDQITDKRPLVVATCNSVATLPPELRRAGRFACTFYVDLPDAAARAAIWRSYAARYGVTIAPDALVAAEWTGAEIKACCRLARDLEMPVEAAAEFIVPISQSMRERLRELRQQAAGRYTCAHTGRPYTPPADDSVGPPMRAISYE